MKKLPITIIIPSKDDFDIKRCIDSIDVEAEIIIALNGSTEAYKNFVYNVSNAKTISIRDANLGKAFDCAINAATNDLILLMNSDCVFSPNAIEIFYSLLQKYECVRGKIIFQYDNSLQKIVSLNREQAYNGNIYNPGLAFNRKIKDRIGYFFDHDIHWTEDADFNRRVKAFNVNYYISDDVKIFHKPVSVMHDLKSAFRIGIGRRIAEMKNLYGTYPEQWRFFPKFIKDQWRKKKYLPLKVYGTIWWLSYITGYFYQTFFDPYRVFKCEEICK